MRDIGSRRNVKSRRQRGRREVLEMSGRNWILVATAHFLESIVSKIRAVFSLEMSSQSTHFPGAEER